MKGGGRGAITIQLSWQCRDLSRALILEMLLSPPIPVGGGPVETNDWCISITKVRMI